MNNIIKMKHMVSGLGAGILRPNPILLLNYSPTFNLKMWGRINTNGIKDKSMKVKSRLRMTWTN